MRLIIHTVLVTMAFLAIGCGVQKHIMSTALDYTEFTEAGPNAGDHSTISTSTLTLAGIQNQDDAWLYKDFGAGNITDFSHQFEFLATSSLASVVIWGVGDVLGTYQDRADASDGFSLLSSAERFFLFDSDGGTNVGPMTISNGTTYYVTVARTGTSLVVTARTGSHTGSVAGTLTETVGTDAYRYLFGYCSRDASGTQSSSLTISNLTDTTEVPAEADVIPVTDTDMFFSP
jgi:hypothetical protein